MNKNTGFIGENGSGKSTFLDLISGLLDPSTGKILVKGVNLKFKHVKPNKEGDVGEIKQLEAPIHHSNVKIYKN